jgi:hypothetical protein
LGSVSRRHRDSSLRMVLYFTADLLDAAAK